MKSDAVTPPVGWTTLSMSDAIERLRTRLVGGVLLPDSEGYDAARRVWNGFVDKRPAAILLCASPEDVVEAVNVARDSGLAVAVRGGGHSIAGASVCDGGLVIDLSRMKRIQVDPVRRTARAEPGLTLGEFDTATQAHGLATTMGVNSDTGIAGLTLGGGLGRLGRKHGLACDNLRAAEIVLADGQLVRASPAENSDLFWAIRGGGGNFGVVTAFEYQLHPLGPTVLGGMLLYDWAQARHALQCYVSFLRTAPDAVDALGVLLTSPAGDPVFAISAFFAGPVEAGEQALTALRQSGPPPIEDAIAPIPYVTLQASADGIFPRGRRYYWRSHFLRDLPDEGIDILLENFARVPSPMSVLALQPLGGVIARIGVTETAFANRDAFCDYIPISIWETPSEDGRNIAWARQTCDAMTRFATGGVYVNNLGEEGEERIRAAYGPNYARLAALKVRYDPDNLFRLNQNIRA